MKNLIQILFFLIGINLYSQTVIDYKNFNNDLATKILAQKFIEFRDTITQFGGGNSLFTDSRPELKDNQDLLIPKWSDYLYEKTSKPNCNELNKVGHSVWHVDVSKWFYSETTKSEIAKIKFQGSKIPQNFWVPYSSSLVYNENVCSLMDDHKTYEELAVYIINLWENSPSHRNVQRGISHSHICYKKYNEKIYGIFSCRVIYNSNFGTTKAVLNMVN